LPSAKNPHFRYGHALKKYLSDVTAHAAALERFANERKRSVIFSAHPYAAEMVFSHRIVKSKKPL
jgi:hypothetical protein